MKMLVVLAVILLLPLGSAAAEPPPITGAELWRDLVVLGSDALEGRAPGTRGGDLAAAYLARRMQEIGLEPLGEDGGFLQPVPIQVAEALPESELVLHCEGRERRLELGPDYLLYSGGAQTWIPRPVPVVFVGYGIVAPEFDHNDYFELDVAGRVVVMLEGEPPSSDPDHFAGDDATVYSAATAKQRIAISRGAVGSLIIPLPRGSRPLADRWIALEREFAFPTRSLAYSVPQHLSALLHPDAARALFEGASQDLDGVVERYRAGTLAAFELGTAVSFHGAFRLRHVLAPNLVGRIPGRDPGVVGEAVVLSAHYDGLGVGPKVGDDAVYNGVVDNAIGVAGVLAVAERLVARPTRRPVIVLLTTGEESGLLGVSFYLDHPPVPLAETVAAVNVDGLAFQGPFCDVVGAGAELSELGRLLERVARRRGLRLSEPAAQFSAIESFARSDQVAFAEAGVPAILVSEGLDWPGVSEEAALRRQLLWLAAIYHSPADDLRQALDLNAAAAHAELIADLVRAVADAPKAPQWYPGVRYAYARLLSLAGQR